MSRHLFSLNSIRKGIIFLSVSSLLGASAVIAISINTQPRDKNSYQEREISVKKIAFETSSASVLIPMPLGDLALATQKVRSTRDHFQELPSMESDNLDILNSALKFNGIAKSGNSLVAMIQTKKGQKIYKVGDSLGNGFIIQGISAKNITVDISNGYKNYRLSLNSLE